MFSIYRRGRICSLFTIHDQIPKLNVAGSIPVSRSIYSTIRFDNPKRQEHPP
jgi:hypothetical protein